MDHQRRLLFFGHLANDTLYTSLPPLLPILASHHRLTAAALGLIPSVYLMTASFLQIAVGELYDRRPRTALMSFGLFLGGASVAAIGFVDNYPLIVLLAFLGGVGSALFHPLATSLSSVSHKRSSSVSIFMVGGDFGLALGSIICTAAVAYSGLRGTAILVVLPLLAGILLLRGIEQTMRISNPSENQPIRTRTRRLAVLISAASLRAITAITIITFLPLYLTSKGASVTFAGSMLTLMLLVGAAGIISAGFLAEKIPKTRTAQLFLILSVALIPALVFSPGEYAVVVLAAVGFSLYAVHPVLVAMSHDLMPEHLGFASAAMYGLTFGLANLTVPLMGAGVDVFGFETMFLVLAVFPAVATLLVSHVKTITEKDTVN